MKVSLEDRTYED